MRWIKTAGITAALVLLAVSSARAQNPAQGPDPKLVAGTWKSDAGATVKFEENGRFAGTIDGRQLSGGWTFQARRTNVVCLVARDGSGTERGGCQPATLSGKPGDTMTIFGTVYRRTE